MLMRTHFLTPMSLPLPTLFLTLLFLFSTPPTAIYAQSLPDGADGGQAPTLFQVDRTDDDVTAQACTDAPNDCSLRGAVIRANQEVSATVYLSVNTTYQVTIPPDAVNDASTGDLNITANMYIDGFGAWTICIVSDCTSAIIQAEGLGDRILRIENGATVRVNELNLRNSGHADLAAGGGILVTGNAHLTLKHVTITGSHAQNGGGLAIEQGGAVLTQSDIQNNTAGQHGGGLWVGATATVEMTEGSLNNNGVTDLLSGAGGGLYNQGNVTLTGVRISFNYAIKGGGGIDNHNLLVIDKAHLHNNSVQQGDGGAILNQPMTATVVINRTDLYNNNAQEGNGGAIWNAGRLTVIGATLAENHTRKGGIGGAIYHQSGELQMVNSTLSGNEADDNVGALYVAAEGQGELTHVTIAKNYGLTIGGLHSLNPAFRISNSLLADNFNFLGYDDCTGSFTSGGYNLLARSSCTRLGLATSDITDVYETILSGLQNNGGATATHALLPGNPALNAGSPDSCSPVDQRGVARPQGGRCDIGAYEASFYFIPLVTR